MVPDHQARKGHVLENIEVGPLFPADIGDSAYEFILKSYADAFFHPVEYNPTDKAIIDRGIASARRLLTPHVLILQLLFSRMQTARYRRPGLMLLIQRLVLASARAHRSIRSAITNS